MSSTLIGDGEFPHQCYHEGCEEIVIYDDEPYCFIHSPDEGSSVQGFSARERASLTDVLNDSDRLDESFSDKLNKFLYQEGNN